jgi:hypothetical protein
LPFISTFCLINLSGIRIMDEGFKTKNANDNLPGNITYIGLCCTYIFERIVGVARWPAFRMLVLAYTDSAVLFVRGSI